MKGFSMRDTIRCWNWSGRFGVLFLPGTVDKVREKCTGFPLNLMQQVRKPFPSRAIVLF